MDKRKNILLLSSKPTVGIMNQIRESEVRDWNVVTREDLESTEKELSSKDLKDDDFSDSVIPEKSDLYESKNRTD